MGFEIKHQMETIEIHEKLTCLPLRDVVVFPNMIFPLHVGRPASLNALQESMMADKQIFLVTQRRVETEDPRGREDLHRIGVVARVLQVMRLPQGTVRILVEGLCLARVVRFQPSAEFLQVKIEVLPPASGKPDAEIEALVRRTLTYFEQYLQLNKRIPEEILVAIRNFDDPQRQADVIAAHIAAKPLVKQSILKAATLREQLVEISAVISKEIEILKIELELEGQVKDSINRSQREYYLQQQMKAIREELGESDDPQSEINALQERVNKSAMPDAVKTVASAEIRKLSKMHPASAEGTVTRNYLDWLLDLPWGIFTADRLEIDEARKILAEDHYGLEKIKERILEYLAVLKLVGKIRGPILCLVGPPGVGKTSLGRSIARALGRKFVRFSLGGVRDEAEIRGHRRTYIGALPGRIVQLLKKAGTMNPVILLDEVDKMNVDFRGDPASALLEVLDPEQNSSFNDHYLEIDLDLSDVLFLTTANTTHSIAPALLDRMEVIALPGYMDFEKFHIARSFLLPKQLKENGLSGTQVQVADEAIRCLINDYTREAGVRELERQIAAVLRKLATQVAAQSDIVLPEVQPEDVTRFLGVSRYEGREVESPLQFGSAIGLAWTPVGGDILKIEVILHESKPEMMLTGKLGDVMQESAKAAFSWIRSRSREFGLDPKVFSRLGIHIHIPEGAIPKDGPSAGITLATALISALTRKRVKSSVAMTGEITLGGKILPVGGLNEKILAAKRAGITTVIIPAKNRKELSEFSAELLSGMELIQADSMDQVIPVAFEESPMAVKLPLGDDIPSWSVAPEAESDGEVH